MGDPGGALGRARHVPEPLGVHAIGAGQAAPDDVADPPEPAGAAGRGAAARDLDAALVLAEQTVAIHEELTAICLDCGQPGAVLAALRRLTGGQAALLDEELAVLAADPPDPAHDPTDDLQPRRDALRAHGARSRVFLTPRGTWLIVAPVRAAGTDYGHLCLSVGARPRPSDTVATEQAAIACALLLARGDAALVGERRQESEFIWDLLDDRTADEAEALARMTRANRVLDLPARLVLLELGRLDERARLEGWDGERLASVRAGTARAVLEQFEGVGRARPASAARGGTLVVIVPVDPAAPWSRPRRLGELALVGGGRARQTVTGVGVSGLVTSVPGLSAAFRQAQLALTAAGNVGGVAVFEELGVLQFLLAPAERADLDQFAGRVLGALVGHDRAKGSDLLHSLEVYLDSDCNIGRAAGLLFVHYKTMRNRLARIEELTHLSLDRQADRFDAQLALKILRLSAPNPA